MAYYPLNKITPNLFTSGNEFILTTSGKDYKGYYYSAYDGKYFTGKTVSPESEELIKTSDKIIPSVSLATQPYDNISKYRNNITPPSSSVTVPTEQDYVNGYYYRYFSKRVNGDLSTIIELSKSSYDSLASNVLYNRVQLRWMIRGPLEDQYISGMLVLGVINRNLKEIQQASKQMLYLDQYLINPTQYFKK